ncbi:hypothetical protein EG68_08712 [Paragonimus skrjabini miyazakii]|uniref:Cas1p 10 TM acyl transferase domain-containing protein n=1 Tax=Paragonimus skrjabini miyazakii TaxID=59628 RepID=A0A8S9Y8V5_9TREM|nr:hypothetical protein EG68_08712 [Paragonimus skrjabini miyazakii]
MQLYFLIYHFAGGYSVLPPFMWARICVSSYLFLSGFGHFVYFWRQSIGTSSNSAFRSSSSDWNEFSFVHSWWPILKRYLDVMFRMNFFVIPLCFVMDVDYLFYYFMPLISFWFTVVVMLMAVGSCHSASSDSNIPTEMLIPASDEMPSQPSSFFRKTQFFSPYIVMLFKFALLIVLIEIVYRVRPLFHFIFYSWFIRKIFKLDKPEPNIFKAAENTDFLAEQFWFYRWSLDRYTTVWGMLFAFCCEWLRRVNLMDDSACSDLVLFNRKSSLIWVEKCHRLPAASIPKSLSRVTCLSTVRKSFDEMFGKISESYFIWLFPACATIFGLGGLILTIICTTFLRNRQFGMELHAYLCIFPIISYILVRNSFGFLRARYSIFFAWFGDISLEASRDEPSWWTLFIGQYHIWLANNTHGVLTLLPNYQVLNLILTTLIFVCVCHEVHQLTSRLHTYVVPRTPQALLWRSFVLCFLLFLLTFTP